MVFQKQFNTNGGCEKMEDENLEHDEYNDEEEDADG